MELDGSEAMESDNPPNPDRLEESDTKVGILSAGDESSYRLPTQEELKLLMFPESCSLEMLGHNLYHPDSGEEAATVVDRLASKSQYCGVETDYETEGYIPLRSNISGGFKFILCPLVLDYLHAYLFLNNPIQK